MSEETCINDSAQRAHLYILPEELRRVVAALLVDASTSVLTPQRRQIVLFSRSAVECCQRVDHDVHRRRKNTAVCVPQRISKISSARHALATNTQMHSMSYNALLMRGV